MSGHFWAPCTFYVFYLMRLSRRPGWTTDQKLIGSIIVDGGSGSGGGGSGECGARGVAVGGPTYEHNYCSGQTLVDSPL